jgi:hypothetical protein
LHVRIPAPKLPVVTFVETVIMNLRLAAMAPLCRETAVPVLVLALIAVAGFAASDRLGAPDAGRLVQSLTADAKFTDAKLTFAKLTDAKSAEVRVAEVKPVEVKPAELKSSEAKPSDEKSPDVKSSGEHQLAAHGAAEVVTVARPAPEAAVAEATPAASKPAPVVIAALTEPSETLRPESALEQATQTAAIAHQPGDANVAPQSTGGPEPTEIVDECFVVETCVDRYLWMLYQRAPKEDAVRTQEQRKVTVKRKGKLVTVTRNFTAVADEDFAWKDPKAAERSGMTLADYVIGGVDPDFKLRLFQMLHAAEQAGLSPGITSAFRDDYRQSIASGLKAADNRSYHGGSLRGGYGHGLAADIVSVKGATRAERLASTQILWKWVDAHGKDFGIGRPYLDRDPPHVAPIDGKEYADHHPKMQARQARAAAKPRKLAAADAAPKHARAAKSSKLSSL